MSKQLSEQQYLEIAKEYASEGGYDLVRTAGSRNGYLYFHYMRKSNIGHKLGLPHIIRINPSGIVSAVYDLEERMWASSQVEPIP